MANQIKYKVGFDVDNKSLKSLRDQLLQLQKMTSKDFMKINPGSSLSQAQKELQQIKKTAKQVDDALDKAFNSKLGTMNLTDLKTQLKGLPIDKIHNDFSRMGATGEAAFRNLATQMMTVNTRARQTHSILDKMATTLGNTLKWNIASTAINGISRSVEQAWGYVKSLDGSLNDIRIVTGKSSEEMANFAVQANEAAKSLGKTTTDYTKASLIYAQQGLDDEEVAARAAITLKAANVTGQSTDDVSEQLTAVWNGYKVTADQAELYVDRLAAVAATTASDLEELSTGMSKVASAAAAMGVGEDQLAAQLSTIISVTKQAPESVGTALRTVYARISDIKAGIDEDGVTLGNYSGKMKELGFNVLDASGNLRDMGEVMEQIGGRWQDLTREQQISLAQTMAGQRQYNNLLALFDNFEAYNQALNTAQNAAGTLQQQQDIYMESTAAHLNTLKASVEDIYDSFMNRDSLDSVNDLIDVLSDGAAVIARFVDSLGGGMNILSSLGSLGITVFSKQIAGSIQTTINNLERGREQANAFKIALQNAQKLKDEGKGNLYTQRVLDGQSTALSLGNRLSQDDFNAIQNNMINFSAKAGQVEQLQQKINQLSESFENKLKISIQDVGPVMDQIKNRWGSLNDALESEDGITFIQQSLQKYRESFDPVLKKISELGQHLKALKNINPNDTSTFSAYRSRLTEANEAAKSLLTTLKSAQINGKNLTDLLPKSSVLSIKEAEKALNGLYNTAKSGKGFSNTLNAQQARANAAVIEQVFRQLRQVVVNEINEIEKNIQNADAGQLEQLQQKLRAALEQLEALDTEFKKLNERSSQTIKIQDFVNIAGGIGQVGSAIQQIQSLGNIWSSTDIGLGQKLLQTITNLSFSLPMLISGYMKAGTALGFFDTSMKATQISTLAGTRALNLGFISFRRITAGAHEGAIAVQLFDKSFLMTGIGAFIVGVTAAAAAVFLLVKAFQAYNKHKIEADKKIVEEQNQIQQEINKNQELYDSVEKLNNQYKNNEITRAELKSGIQDLIDQYGIEGKQVKDLTGDYENLTETLKTLREEEAKKAVDSGLQEQDKEADIILRQARQGKGRGIIGQSYTAEFANDASVDLEKRLGNIANRVSEYGSTKDTSTVSFTMDYDIDHMIQLYDQLIKVKQELVESGQMETKEYEQVSKWLSKLTEDVNKYKAATQDINENAAFLQGVTQNFDDINSFNQYREQRQAFIKSLGQNQNIKSDDLGALADTYLSKFFPNLQEQFGEGIKQIDQFKEKFGEIPKQVDDLIKGLSEEDFNKFLQLDPDLLSGWEQLVYLLEHVNQSNKQTETTVGDIQARNRANLDNFKKYDEVKQNVSQGKEIKEKDYQALAPQLQQFFNYAGDGMYQLANDAKGFYDAIDSLKLQGFQETAQAIANEIQNLQNVQAGNFDYEKLNQSAYKGGLFNSSIDQDLAQEQLQYLDAATTKGSELNMIVQDLLDKESLSKDDIEQINNLISQVGDKTKDIDGNLTSLNDSLKQQYQQMYDAMFPTDEDVDTKALQALSDKLQQIAGQTEGLADTLEKDGRAAEDVAQSILRFDDAVTDVVDNYDAWMGALTSGSLAEQAEAIAGLRDAYADLLDLDGSSLSDAFLSSTQNLNLMKAAIDGDTDAYNQLMQAVQQDIVAHLQLSPEDYSRFTSEIENVRSMMDEMNFEDIQVGASLDDDDFIAGLENMINAANMTAQQATDYLASMGVDAEIVQVKDQQEEQKTQTGWTSELVPNTEFGEVPIISGIGNGTTVTSQKIPFTTYSSKYSPTTETATDVKENSAFSLKVTSAHKSSGGGFKFSNAPNGGGSKGTKRRNKGSGGGGGGKGGGGGGGSKPDTSKKDAKKPLKSDKDPYHDINIKLRDINDQLEKMEKHQERLWGKQAFDNLNKQNELLKDQLDALKEKNKIQRQELSKQRKNLQGRGVTFDTDGNISNYTSILQQQESKVQAMYDQYNKWVKKYNESTDADYKKGISEAMSDYDKQIKEEETVLKELKSDIDKYDKTQEQIQKNLDEQDETNQKIIENNIKKFRMQIEIRLDMGKAERDWNEFRRNVLEKTDVLKGTEFDNIFGDASQNFSDLFSYFNVHGSMGTVEKLTNQLHGTLEQLQQIDKTGTSAIYGDNKAQAMEDLQGDLEELMDQMKDIEGLIDDIDQAYLDTIDDIQDQFDKQIEDYEYVQQLLENDMDLLTLLYGDKNYEAMQKYYDQMYQNNLKQLDSLRQQREFWKQEWDAAIARGDINAAEKFEQNYKNAISNINSVIQDSIENLQDSYSNAVEKIFDALDNKLTNGKGTEYLKQSWDLMNKNADEYLDTVNSAFAIQDTQRKYQNALNDTKNIKNQQALKKLMDEQLNILKNKEKLTQYDIDRAQKLLEVEQARIALEDARSAKTSMRLKRDSQGNYSYEYYADEEGIGEAEQNYANAQNDLYNFDLDKTKQTTNEILSAWQEFKDKYKEIMLDVTLSDEERHEKLKLLQDQYGEYFNLKTEQLANVRLNLMDSAFKDLASLYNADVENYNGMADAEKDILMGNIVPTWKNGVVEMTQIMAGEGGLLPVCQDAFDDLDETTKEYQDDLQELAVAAGVDFNDIQNGIDDTANDLSDLIETNDELISRMSDELLAITLLKDQAHRLMEEYQNVKDAAIDAVNQIHNYIQAQQAQAADYIANQKAMANAQSNAYMQVADAYVAAINKMRAAINAANSSSGGSGSPGGGGSNPGGTSPGSNNNSDNYSVVSNPYGASGTYGVQDSSGDYVEISGNLGYLKDKYGFATGGYTGNWNSDEGRIAVLHEKELILNKEDTANMLDAVKIIRSLNDNVSGKVYDINTSLANGKTQSNDNKETIEQDVHITATFPNVNTKQEIEEAFSELANRAAQRVLKR